jgi:hypothetical protein
MLDAGCSMLDAGFWMLDARCSMLDAGYWMLDAGYGLRVAGCGLRDTSYGSLDTRCWMLDAGFWILDAGCWQLKLQIRFLSITSNHYGPALFFDVGAAFQPR